MQKDPIVIPESNMIIDFIKHIILAPDILDLDNLDFVLGTYQNFNLALWQNDIVTIWDHFHWTYHIGTDQNLWVG